MMFEAVEVIQKLFSGKDVKHAGEFFKLHSTRLWTMPDTASADPRRDRRPDHGAAHRAPAVTASSPPGHRRRRSPASSRSSTRVPGPRARTPTAMPKLLQLHLSWAPTDEEALTNAMTEWPNGGMKFSKQDVRSPHDFAQMAALVRPEDFDGRMVISADPDRHRAEIQRFLDLGITHVYLHNVGRNQTEWMEVFGRDVLAEAASLRSRPCRFPPAVALARDDPQRAPVRPTRGRARPGAPLPRPARWLSLLVDRRRSRHAGRAHRVVVHGRPRGAGARTRAARPRLQPRGDAAAHPAGGGAAARVGAPAARRRLRRTVPGAWWAVSAGGVDPDPMGAAAVHGADLGRCPARRGSHRWTSAGRSSSTVVIEHVEIGRGDDPAGPPPGSLRAARAG